MQDRIIYAVPFHAIFMGTPIVIILCILRILFNIHPLMIVFLSGAIIYLNINKKKDTVKIDQFDEVSKL